MLLSVGCRRTEEPARPKVAGLDVVLVTVDTWRADAAGFAGHPRLKTPAFDRFAARGRVFVNARAQAVLTLPSHAVILTGLLPFQHGLRDNAGAKLRPDVPTLATRLKDRGYATGAFVSSFPLDVRWGLSRGFDVYDDRYGKGTDTGQFIFPERRGVDTVAAALDWWKKQTPGKRLLWVHVFEPHAPYVPPPPFDAEYRDAPYLGEVAAADAALAPLLDEILTASGPPILAVLTGDHGESLGEHGEETHGLFAYDATLRIPLVAYGPRVSAGRDMRPVGHIDIVPTVLDALGILVDPKVPGRSLFALEDPAADSIRLLYFEALSASLNRGWAPLTGLVRGGLKYVDLPIRELYDLSADPHETVNVAPERDADVRALARLLPAEAKKPALREAPTREEAAKLRSLGYVTTSGPSAAKAAYTKADDPKRLVDVDQAIHRIIDLYQRAKLPESIGAAETLFKAHPSLTVAVEHLAFLYQQSDRLPDAARLLKAYFAARPEPSAASESLRVRYGMVLAEMGRAREAVGILSPLAGSADPDSLNAFGVALADAGELVRARELFSRALTQDPGNPSTLENFGILDLKERKWEAARAGFRKALSVNPRLPNSLNGLGAAEAELGNLGAAIEAWKAAVSASPGDLDALLNLGRAAARGGQPDVAAGALNRFLALAPPARLRRERAEAEAILKTLAPPPATR